MTSRITRSAVLLAGVLSLDACAQAGADPAADPPASGQASTAVWQLAPFALLARGEYDGLLPVGAVKRHGDLGLGAADQLDGEMALVDGRWYQFLENGRAVVPPDSMRTPFAAVTFWDRGQNVTVDPGLRYGPGMQFQAAVDSVLPTVNAFYAIRMEGTFEVVVARTFRRQTKPYPPLNRASADTFTITGVQGTMVGFRQPSYSDSLSVPNYHLHFVDAGRTRGGHVLSFTTRDVRMQVAQRPDFILRMPQP